MSCTVISEKFSKMEILKITRVPRYIRTFLVCFIYTCKERGRIVNALTYGIGNTSIHKMYV